MSSLPPPLQSLEMSGLLALFWSHSGEGLALVDASIQVQAINPALEKLLGDQPLVVLNEDKSRYEGGLAGLHGTSLFLQSEPDIPVIVSAYAVGPQWLLFIQDRSQEVYNERLTAEMASNEHVRLKAGSLAHDFNNLLTAMLGNISLAMMHVSKEGKAQTLLEVAHQAGARSQAMAKQLLTLSKQNAEAREPIQIGQALQEAARLLERGSPCTFKVTIEPDLWPVQANMGQISQVFNNLIINAIHASPPGGVLELRAFKTQEGPEQRAVQVEIQDHGTGIEPEHLPKLFEPYFTTKKTGSGLGLPSVKALVEDHGGHIRVDSTLGEGTTMTLVLPGLKAQPKEKEPLAHEPEKPLLMRSGQGRILLMDDEQVIQQIGSEMLKHLHYEVTLANDGQEALELYKAALGTPDAFSALILDLAIPGGKGGREIIKPLKELDPSVVALVSTGYSEDPAVKDPQAHGFAATLTKPYTLNGLGETLAQALGNDGSVELPPALKRKASLGSS